MARQLKHVYIVLCRGPEWQIIADVYAREGAANRRAHALNAAAERNAGPGLRLSCYVVEKHPILRDAP